MQNSGTAQNWEGHCLSQHCIKTAVTFSPTLSHTLNIDKSIKQCTKLFWAERCCILISCTACCELENIQERCLYYWPFRQLAGLNGEKYLQKMLSGWWWLTVKRNIFSWIEKLVCSRWTLESLVNTWGAVCTVMNGHSVQFLSLHSAARGDRCSVQSVTDSLSQQQ